MKQKRHATEEIIRIIREAASDKDLEAIFFHDPLTIISGLLKQRSGIVGPACFNQGETLV